MTGTLASERSSGRSHRLFFALWPSEELRAHVHESTRELVRRIGGRVIPPANLHVTLVFLGSVPVTALDDIVRTASDIQAGAFELEFDRAQIWRRAQVLVLTAGQTPASLRSLVDGLQISSLQSKASSAHEEYRAHITLARAVHARGGPDLATVPGVKWAARDFVLVESKPGPEGSIYSVLHRWALA